MGVIAEVEDADDIGETGWGLVLPADGGTELRSALRPLIDWRRAQAGGHYRELEWRRGESAARFLARYGTLLDVADPNRVPYYLLLAGGPNTLPLELQFQLSLFYAVGRVAFDFLDGYRNYAERVVRAGDPGPPVERIDLVAPGNPDDQLAQLTTRWLIGPLASALKEKGLPVETSLGSEPTKARLKGLLTRTGAPGLLFFAGHGVGFPSSDPRQAASQGALLCADWPGPAHWSGPLAPEFYLSGDDVADSPCPGASVALLYASYSAAAPAQDLITEHPVAPRPLVAPLPQRLLGFPGEGTLAVIGMADRVWAWAFDGPRSQGTTASVRNILLRLVRGDRIGRVLDESVSNRYAQLSGNLSAELEERAFGKQSENNRLIDLWTARSDARATILLGDPAVRLAPRARQSVP